MLENNNFKRLLPEDVTLEEFDRVLRKTCGHFGIYDIKEAKRLESVLKDIDVHPESENPNYQYELLFKGSKLDRNVGHVKFSPRSIEAVKRLDRYRAYKIIDRNNWLSKYHAIGFVQETKRSLIISTNPNVQGFLLRNYHHPRLHELLDKPSEFRSFILEYLRDDFNSEQIEAIREHLPSIICLILKTIMSKPKAKNKLKKS